MNDITCSSVGSGKKIFFVESDCFACDFNIKVPFYFTDSFFFVLTSHNFFSEKFHRREIIIFQKKK